MFSSQTYKTQNHALLTLYHTESPHSLVLTSTPQTTTLTIDLKVVKASSTLTFPNSDVVVKNQVFMKLKSGLFFLLSALKTVKASKLVYLHSVLNMFGVGIHSPF